MQDCPAPPNINAIPVITTEVTNPPTDFTTFLRLSINLERTPVFSKTPENIPAPMHKKIVSAIPNAPPLDKRLSISAFPVVLVKPLIAELITSSTVAP